MPANQDKEHYSVLSQSLQLIAVFAILFLSPGIATSSETTLGDPWDGIREKAREDDSRFIAIAENPDQKSLPTISVWQREDNLDAVYVAFTHPVENVEAPNSTFDAYCYEIPMHFVGARDAGGGKIEIRHALKDNPHWKIDSHPSRETMLYHMALVTTITPEPGAVEMVAQYKLDAGFEIEGGLPENFVTQEVCLVCLKPYSAFASSNWPAEGRLFWGGEKNSGNLNVHDEGASNPDYFIDYVRRTRMFGEDGVTNLSKTHRMILPWHEEDDYRQKPFPWISNYAGSWLEGPPPQFANFSSTDRYTKSVIWCKSRNGRHLMGSACDSADFMMQAWGCMHNYADFLPADAPALERKWRLKIYFMENDSQKFLDRATKDFPGLAGQPYPEKRAWTP